jgi:hypothetical protein
MKKLLSWIRKINDNQKTSFQVNDSLYGPYNWKNNLICLGRNQRYLKDVWNAVFLKFKK